MMKKALFIITIIILSFGACTPTNTNKKDNRQNKELHQTFKGIPIDSTATKMVKLLEDKGYQFDETFYKLTDTYSLEGKFAGYDDCTIYLNHTFEDEIVYEVVVALPAHGDWISLQKNFYDLKTGLDEKYGESTDSAACFLGEAPPVDDEMRYWEVINDRCDYHARYETKKGVITLKIAHTKNLLEFNICRVTLSYLDNTNYELYQKEAHDDL